MNNEIKVEEQLSVSKEEFSEADLIKINEFLTNEVLNIIESYVPHRKISSIEPFINQYNGKVSYDYSGEVEEITVKNREEFLEDIYSDTLESVFTSVFVNSWRATRESNYGKSWISYMNILDENFNQWVFEEFKVFDVEMDEEILIDELSCESLNLLYTFVEDNSGTEYLDKIMSSIVPKGELSV